MKKIAKISLVAAIAVAGFTTANAQPLEEAIKNVDVTGSVVYRYNDVQDDGRLSTDPTKTKDGVNNNYKVGLNLSSKVNDDVKFNARFLVADQGSTVDGNFEPLDTSAASDTNVSTSLSNANFAYTGVKNTTVTVGKQGLATPYTIATQIDDNEQTGTGILALSAIGPVTLGAAYFNQTNIDKSGDLATTLVGALPKIGAYDISALAAIGAFGPVTVDAWYLDLAEVFDTYTVGAKSDFDVAGVKLGATARYASLTLEDAVATALSRANKEDNSIVKVGLTAKTGIVSAALDYAATDKDGGITALDSDAVTALKGWYLNSLNKADADYWKTSVGVDILANLNLSANYGNLQHVVSAVDIEEEELYGQLTYKMSKNLSTYVRYGTYTKDAANQTKKDIDAEAGRLQVAYTF